MELYRSFWIIIIVQCDRQMRQSLMLSLEIMSRKQEEALNLRWWDFHTLSSVRRKKKKKENPGDHFLLWWKEGMHWDGKRFANPWVMEPERGEIIVCTMCILLCIKFSDTVNEKKNGGTFTKGATLMGNSTGITTKTQDSCSFEKSVTSVVVHIHTMPMVNNTSVSRQ